MPGLEQIKNIVVLMMENRSFDHLLGYLSLPPESRGDVEGLQSSPALIQQFTNRDGGASYVPFANPNPYTMPGKFDPPHERRNVALNLGTPAGGTYPMNGFVSAIPADISANPAVRQLVMGHFTADTAPMTHFLAQNFTICDRWYSALPAGTQPNRLMAMSGLTKIEINTTPLPDQELVYDWLTTRNVSWCVYHQGIPFFTMMPRCIPMILGSTHFKNFSDLAADIANSPPDALPSVIFVEPTYQDAPHLGRATDEHAPTGIADGEDFIQQVYNAVTASPAFWKSCLLIVDYDEHGGFFDHVSPPLTPTAPPPGANYTAAFASLGVRTPGIIVSPFVRPGAVCHETFDHTSVLKLLGEKFDSGGKYGDPVDDREVESLSAALVFDNPINDPPAAPALTHYLANRAPAPVGATVPERAPGLTEAFSDAAVRLNVQGAGPDHPKFGPLMQALFPAGAA